MARQNGWRWCYRCQGLFFAGNPSQGACPAGGSHDASQSGHYAMLFSDAIFGAQNNWRWCQKCQGLYFAGNPSQGTCPAGGSHDASASGHYSLMFGDHVTGTQGSWRWCQKCQGLFFAGNPAQGPCPVGGNHDSTASAPYGTPWENPGVSQLDFDTGVISFGGGVPIGGSAHVTLHQDGSYNFVGHFHKSSIVPYDYSVALTVLDSDNRLYTFSHQYSFGGGVADDNFPYSGNNGAIAQNWLALVPGASFRWQANASLDLGALISAIESAIQEAGPIISAVLAIV
jgi:hypothetical protein